MWYTFTGKNSVDLALFEIPLLFLVPIQEYFILYMLIAVWDS